MAFPSVRLRVKDIVVHQDGDPFSSGELRFYVSIGGVEWTKIYGADGINDGDVLRLDFETTFPAHYQTRLIYFRVIEKDSAIEGGDQQAQHFYQFNHITHPLPQRTLFIRASKGNLSATLNFTLEHVGVVDGLVFQLTCLGHIPGPTVLALRPGEEAKLVNVVQKAGKLTARQVGNDLFRIMDDSGFGARGVLDGNTVTGQVSVLQPGDSPSGTVWRVHHDGGGKIGLECQGHIPGPRWLDGNTVNATVRLAHDRPSGTYWKIV